MAGGREPEVGQNTASKEGGQVEGNAQTGDQGGMNESELDVDQRDP
jgi:hypothetical protein